MTYSVSSYIRHKIFPLLWIIKDDSLEVVWAVGAGLTSHNLHMVQNLAICIISCISWHFFNKWDTWTFSFCSSLIHQIQGTHPMDCETMQDFLDFFNSIFSALTDLVIIYENMCDWVRICVTEEYSVLQRTILCDWGDTDESWWESGNWILTLMHNLHKTVFSKQCSYYSIKCTLV